MTINTKITIVKPCMTLINTKITIVKPCMTLINTRSTIVKPCMMNTKRTIVKYMTLMNKNNYC